MVPTVPDPLHAVTADSGSRVHDGVGRTFLSAAVEFAVDFKFAVDLKFAADLDVPNTNSKIGGQECPPYTSRCETWIVERAARSAGAR